MKPDADLYLGELARALAADFAPALATAYAQSALTRHAMLAAAAAEEFDRAASRRIEENAAIRAIFASALPLAAETGFASALREASDAKDTDFRVRKLDETNRGLRALLIELHEHVERIDGERARALEDRIWSELARSTERRRLAMGKF